MSEKPRIVDAVLDGGRLGFKVTAWIVSPLFALFILANWWLGDDSQIEDKLATLIAGGALTVVISLLGGTVGAIVRGLFAAIDASLNSRAKRP